MSIAERHEASRKQWGEENCIALQWLIVALIAKCVEKVWFVKRSYRDFDVFLNYIIKDGQTVFWYLSVLKNKDSKEAALAIRYQPKKQKSRWEKSNEKEEQQTVNKRTVVQSDVEDGRPFWGKWCQTFTRWGIYRQL